MIILIGIGMCGFAAIATFVAYIESSKMVKAAEQEREVVICKNHELARINNELSSRIKEQELAIIKLTGGIK